MADQNRKMTYTFWISTGSPELVEVARLTGCDGITLDMEHGAFDRGSADLLILLAGSMGLLSFVRVSEPSRIAIQGVLDSGADGVIVPHVENLEHAQELGSYAKYPPLGDRSVGGGRTFDYGGQPVTFFEEQNKRIMFYPMVETVGALKDVEAILRLDTVDGIFLGPADLNMARGRNGVFGEADDRDRKTVADACFAASKDFGMNIFTHKNMKNARDARLTFAALTDNVTVLVEGVKRVVSDARAIIESES